jgi:flagellar biosynthesis/type III secretory pathway M-ring protein FliF/YscJ
VPVLVILYHRSALLLVLAPGFLIIAAQCVMILWSCHPTESLLFQIYNNYKNYVINNKIDKIKFFGRHSP